MPVLPFLPKVLARALGKAGISETVKLMKTTPGQRSSTKPLDGTNPTSVVYTCRGFKGAWITAPRPSATAPSTTNDSGGEINIYGATLPKGVEPVTGDRVFVESAWYVITGNVTRDPTASIYACVAQGI